MRTQRDLVDKIAGRVLQAHVGRVEFVPGEEDQVQASVAVDVLDLHVPDPIAVTAVQGIVPAVTAAAQHGKALRAQDENVLLAVAVQVDDAQSGAPFQGPDVVELAGGLERAVGVLIKHVKRVFVTEKGDVGTAVAVEVRDGERRDAAGDGYRDQLETLAFLDPVDVREFFFRFFDFAPAPQPDDAHFRLVVVGKDDFLRAIAVEINQRQGRNPASGLDEVRRRERDRAVRGRDGHFHVLHPRVGVVLVVGERFDVIEELLDVLGRDCEAQAVQHDIAHVHHADDFAAIVEQRPARVAGGDRRRGLHV